MATFPLLQDSFALSERKPHDVTARGNVLLEWYDGAMATAHQLFKIPGEDVQTLTNARSVSIAQANECNAWIIPSA